MVFVFFRFMFLTNPTVEELTLLDLTVLTDMLTMQTETYLELLRLEGNSTRTNAQMELVNNIQAVIEARRSMSN